MIEMLLSKIKIDESRQEQMIVFKEKNGTRFLPIVIGMAEVNAIKLKLSGILPPRPLTHDLMLHLLQQLGASVSQMVIDRIENNTFYAKLEIKKQDQSAVWVDARPSDGVALAVRANAPIFVSEEVLGTACVNEF